MLRIFILTSVETQLFTQHLYKNTLYYFIRLTIRLSMLILKRQWKNSLELSIAARKITGLRTCASCELMVKKRRSL